jgi:hypothetical protein
MGQTARRLGDMEPDSSTPSSLPRATRGRRPLFAVIAMGAITVCACALTALVVLARMRGLETHGFGSTAAVVAAVRDTARLETTELHIEKIVDLADRQSRFFGLVTATDAILLVASGDVVVGLDLKKLRDEDFEFDAHSGRARLVLPEPEILSTRLDEANTYVYRRSTELLADRNEQLEGRARREALLHIEAAARKTDAFERSKRLAERYVRTLLEKLGVAKVDVRWRTLS